MQNRGPAEVPLGLARWRPRTQLVTCARGMSRAPVSGHAQIATPAVSPRKEKDSGGVSGAFAASQDLSGLFHVCCTPRAVLFTAVNETTALAGFSPGGRWAALHISSWPRPLQGTQERTGVVPHRAVGLGTIAGRILSHLTLESTDSSFSSDRDFFSRKSLYSSCNYDLLSTVVIVC